MSQPDEDKKLADKAPPAATVPGRRSKALREGLLAKLPQLGVPSWDAKDALNVYEDMAGLAEIGVDSLLEPLAVVVKNANG